MPAPRKVWIDTDFGSDSDDSIALLLALASPELDVQGISVVGRQSFVRALMVQAFLNAAGRSDIPVYPGWDVPAVAPAPLNAGSAAFSASPPAPAPVLLQQWAAYQFNWFGNSGWYGSANQPVEGVGVWATPPDSTAAGVALAKAYAANNDIALIAIGPMTNIYQALAHSTAPAFGLPPIAANVPAIYTMGLHFNPVLFNGGFVSPAVDYNLASDPVAALALFDIFAPPGASQPTTEMNFVTADLTLQTWLTTEQLAQINAAGATYPVLAMLGQMIGAWSLKQSQLFRYTIGPTDPSAGQVDNAGFLHDPLTVASSFGAVDPTTSEPFVQFEPTNVELVLDTTSHVRAISHPVAASTSPALCSAVLRSDQTCPLATPASATSSSGGCSIRRSHGPAPLPHPSRWRGRPALRESHSLRGRKRCT